MLDDFGRASNKAQAIRNMDKLRMAYLFDDMQKNSEKYPSTREEWLEWLNKDSGNNIFDL